MSMLARVLLRRQSAMVASALAVLALTTAGCTTRSEDRRQAPVMATMPTTSPKPPCQQYACKPRPPMVLNADYAVRLWSSSATAASGSQNLRSTPVLELVRTSGGTREHVQWWVGRLGYGWTATLTCAAGQHPNCVVSSSVGSHAGNAEIVQLRGAALVSSPATSVTFDSGTPTAADLDGDGYLDIVGLDNDYKPSFATGRNFWTTYRFTGSALHQTGCTPLKSLHQAPPTALLTGPCPLMPSD